ncbi:caspase-10-like [Trematomus bernacchii]|uniref:caspase-10-like n=1 Tax=Trematomus bernacchii TaxID=40690 RepID=UPI00146A8BCD|nr:caspase-10-like [Trematomus bernacchii]XP_033971309.1 caspase-10-like [Trematomus bernacchii]
MQRARLVNKIMNKGEWACQAFLKLLQTDEAIQKTYPELENILEDEQYELKSQPTGLCLIINNKTFVSGKPRRGTDKDAESLGKVFTWLGFRVLMCKDQTKDQMERALKCFASQCDLSQLQEVQVQEWTGSRFTELLEAPQHGDAFICYLLSHGGKGVVFGVDRKPLPIKQITRIFMATPQSPLTAKPKVFLIQACQGDQIHPKVVSDDPMVLL